MYGIHGVFKQVGPIKYAPLHCVTDNANSNPDCPKTLQIFRKETYSE